MDLALFLLVVLAAVTTWAGDKPRRHTNLVLGLLWITGALLVLGWSMWG